MKIPNTRTKTVPRTRAITNQLRRTRTTPKLTIVPSMNRETVTEVARTQAIYPIIMHPRN